METFQRSKKMGHDFSFFIYLFACGTAMAAVALLILVLRMRSGKFQWKDPLTGFVIITFLIGGLYFCERYYSDSFANQGGWSMAERILDLVLCSAQLFVWYLYVRRSADMGRSKLGNITNIFLILIFIVQAIIYLFVMNEHYYIESDHARLIASILNCCFMAGQIALAAAYFYQIVHRIRTKDTRFYLLLITLLLLINFLWQTSYVLMLFHNSPMLLWAYGAFDFISIILLLIDLLTILYILHANFNQVMEEIPQIQAEQKQEMARTEMKESGLSDREIEVALLLLDGKSYDEIAEELFISKYTVKRHAHNLYQKMDVTNKVGLISKFR